MPPHEPAAPSLDRRSLQHRPSPCVAMLGALMTRSRHLVRKPSQASLAAARLAVSARLDTHFCALATAGRSLRRGAPAPDRRARESDTRAVRPQCIFEYSVERIVLPACIAPIRHSTKSDSLWLSILLLIRGAGPLVEDPLTCLLAPYLVWVIICGDPDRQRSCASTRRFKSMEDFVYVGTHRRSHTRPSSSIEAIVLIVYWSRSWAQCRLARPSRKSRRAGACLAARSARRHSCRRGGSGPPRWSWRRPARGTPCRP